MFLPSSTLPIFLTYIPTQVYVFYLSVSFALKNPPRKSKPKIETDKQKTNKNNMSK